MSIDFTLYPVDASLLQTDEAWIGAYADERDREFLEWQQDGTIAAAADDPRRHVMLYYSHHYMNLLNPYLEAAYGIEPYSWFARDPVSEYYFVTPPGEVAALAATLARPPDDVRERLDGLARSNLDMAGSWPAPEDAADRDTAPASAIEQFWELVAALHAQLRDFFQQAAEDGQAMIGFFSP